MSLGMPPTIWRLYNRGIYSSPSVLIVITPKIVKFIRNFCCSETNPETGGQKLSGNFTFFGVNTDIASGNYISVAVENKTLSDNNPSFDSERPAPADLPSEFRLCVLQMIVIVVILDVLLGGVNGSRQAACRKRNK